MAGIPSALLECWAMPAAATPMWDHTYVTSSCGLRWGCWGRDQGGTLLRGAPGSSIFADCLSTQFGGRNQIRRYRRMPPDCQ